ncbi:MAG TPA: sensor histidine kinase [Flavobacteriales bacterium]|jgi:two-component sensor histidine kinase|nr:sensor histidine kinase [Flavobacteriales bacterium]
MSPFVRTPWRWWPILVTCISVAFIAYGIILVSRSSSLQQRISHEVKLLEELNGISESIHQLGLVHRVDLSAQQHQWDNELQKLRTTIEHTKAAYSDSPGMDEMPAALDRSLHQTDSLHDQIIAHQGTWSTLRSQEAVLQIMLQRSQKVVDKATRNVHEQGLSAHSATLGARWSEARVLLIAACLMAVILAWLTGVSNKLLQRSRVNTQQLEVARKNLESTNKELRETMLSKEEKEVMLKEIHHRVKNNLQIVKSLIRFQMDQVKDERTLELFNECVNRVSAMALVHEQTYLSKDLANIDVNAYLTHLTRDLCYAYTIDTKLHLDIRINIPTLSVDTLIPLGLIINEIISNSLKYAFRGRKEGTILVHLDTDSAGGLMLRIGDDGVGLADRTKWEKPQSLGMELIQTLAGQLGTTVDLIPGPGTVYALESVHQEKRKRA